MIKLYQIASACLIGLGLTACQSATGYANIQRAHPAPAVPSGAYQVVDVHRVSTQGIAEKIGTVTLSDSERGLLIQPYLEHLPAGLHGLHIHENASCEVAHKEGQAVAALKAGGHYDPKHTGKHGAPDGDGHLGDLPALVVDPFGHAFRAATAPRLTLADVQGRALMIHQGGDNYSDQPVALGGGGARIACGVIAATQNS